MLLLLYIELDRAVPWGPHFGLDIGINAHPHQVSVRRLIQPRMVPIPEDLKDAKTKDSHQEHQPYTWAQAEADAAVYQAKRPLKHSFAQNNSANIAAEETKELALHYFSLISTIETYLFKAYTGQDAKQEDLEKAVGRGRGPKFRVVKALDNSNKDHMIMGDKDTFYWLNLKARLQELRALQSKARRIEEDPLADPMPGLNRALGLAVKGIQDLPPMPAVQLPEEEPEEAAAREFQWISNLQQPIEIDQDNITDMINKVSAIAIRGVFKAFTDSKEAFQEWVSRQNSAHCKGLFRYVAKGAMHKPELGMYAVNSTAPLTAIEEASKPWKDEWSRDMHMLKETLRAIAALRHIAMAAPLPPITVRKLDAALGTFDDCTGLGMDVLPPKMVKALPIPGKQAIIDLFHACEAKAMLPWQMLQVLIVLLPKPEGGHRPICLLVMLIRIWIRCRRDIGREWVTNTAGQWDDARAGRSPMMAAMERCFLDETAAELGFESITDLWDLHKFHDSIPIGELIHQALNLGFHPMVLLFCVLTYLAPRVLRADECHSLPIQPTNSAVAGCGEANNMAKIIVHSVMKAANSKPRFLQVKQFVDDMPQRMEGTKKMILKDFPAEAVAFAKGLRGIGLVISKKSSIVASHQSLAKTTVQALSRIGVQTKIVRSARDLGHDNTAARFRGLASRKLRLLKFGMKVKRIRKVAEAGGPGSKLFNMSAFPQAAYASPIVGLAPTTVQRTRTKAAQCTGKWGHGSCTTTVLALHNRGRDPYISFKVLLVRTWFQLWTSSRRFRTRAAGTWEKIRDRVRGYHPQARWRNITGPIAALIATLEDAGWATTSPTHWTSPNGSQWKIQQTAEEEDRGFLDVTELIEEFTKTLQSQMWEKAAIHHNGRGLETGFCARQLHIHIAWFNKKERFAEAETLSAVATAKNWTNHRCSTAGYNVAPTCPRCGQQPEDELHRLWTCPCLTVPDEDDQQHMPTAIAATQNVIPQAVSEAERWPCFWLRGLLPNEWLHVTAPEEGLSIKAFGEFTDIDIKEGIDIDALPYSRYKWYSDGSGGKHGSHPLLRRVGWALVAMEQTGPQTWRLVGGWMGNVPGDKQTIPRAELIPVIFLHLLLYGDNPVSLGIDANYVVNGFAKGRYNRPTDGSNPDLWYELGQYVSQDTLTLEVFKVKAHLDVSHVARELITLEDLLGNRAADMAAERAANACQLPGDEVERVLRLENLAWKVQRRLIAMTKAAVQASPVRPKAVQEPEAEPQPQSKPKLAILESIQAKHQQAIDSSGHTLHINVVKAICSRCNQQCLLRNLGQWLQQPCTGQAPITVHTPQAGLPIVVATGPVTIGDRRLHESHRLHFARGVWWCTVCGSYATATHHQKSAPKGLLNICVGPGKATPAGKASLDRVALGNHPRDGCEWPE